MAEPDVTSSPEPAYMSLADELADHIASLQPGARVASEHELVECHSVSRLTARAALQELEARFLVRRVRGAGTFVAHRIDYPVGSDDWVIVSDRVRQLDTVASVSVTSLRTRRPTATVRDLLDLDVDEKVVAISRSGTVDALPGWFEVTHLPADLVPGIGDQMEDDTSIAHVLRDHFEMDLTRAWIRGELIVVPTDVAAHLGLEGRPMAWYLMGCSLDPSMGRPVVLSESWLRTDMFRVRFDA